MELFENPNVDLVWKHHAGRCGFLYDGYIFEPTNQDANGTLAGQLGFGIGIPFYGFNDYHVTSDKDEQNRSILLWCGGYHDMYRSIAAKTGLRLGFMAIPTELDAFIDLATNMDFWFEFFPAHSAILEASRGILRRGEFFSEGEHGCIMMKNRYERLEYIFLNSFTPTSWLFIWTVLIALGGVMSLLEDGTRSLLRRWANDVFILTGLFLGEAHHATDSKNRSLIGVWLLACVVFIGCLGGSLRDLMANADQLIVANEWDELLLGEPPLSDYTVVTVNILPEWGDLKARYDPDLLQRRVKLFSITMPPDREDLSRQMREMIAINMGDMIGIAFIITKRLFYMMGFLYNIYRQSMIDRFLIDMVPDGSREGATKIFEDKFEMSMNEMHFSGSQGGTHPSFFAYTSWTPDEVVTQFDHYFAIYRDNGMAYVSYQLPMRWIEGKLDYLKRPVSTYNQLVLLDVKGPIIVTSLVWVVSAVACLAEVSVRSKMTLKQNKKKRNKVENVSTRHVKHRRRGNKTMTGTWPMSDLVDL